jgi:hypothetical protein
MSRKHLKRTEQSSSVFLCECGKSYIQKKSLEYHKKTCDIQATRSIPSGPNPKALSATEIMLELLQQKLDVYEKEREEMKYQIARLLDKHAEVHTTTNNSNNTILHNIETQHITININAFGNENVDYIDNQTMLACIGRVYKSIPSLLEKIHFDPKHPENHNIKITNKKLPYASVMGNNQKWKTVDRKDAIETMVLNGYNLLDEKYTESKDKLPTVKQHNFEGFQSKFETENKDVMRQIKTEVDMMVLNAAK